MIVALRKKTTTEFFKTLIIKKHLSANFAFNALIYGMSGAGKSSLALRIAEIFSNEKDDLVHVCNEHVIYTPQDFEKVLLHVYGGECDIPVLIYMEAREVLDARRSMSELNMHITRIAQLARTVRRTCNIFCVQREMDIDVRVRACVGIGFEVKRYGLSIGKSTRPFAIPYTVKQLLKDPSERTPDVYVLWNGKLERVKKIKWDIPKVFDYFEQLDKEKKSRLIFGEEIDKESVEQFAREYLEYAEGEKIPKGELYERYLEFCEERGIQPIGKISFGKEIKRLFPDVVEGRNESTRFFVNLRFKQN